MSKRKSKGKSLARSPSPTDSISAKSGKSDRDVSVSLRPITLFLTGIDGSPLAQMIGVYRHMKISELHQMIRNAFDLSKEVKLIGITAVSKDCLIPLSYLVEKPSSIGDEGDAYSLIIERPNGVASWIDWFWSITRYSKEHPNQMQKLIIGISIAIALFCVIWIEFGFPPLLLIYFFESVCIAPFLGALFRHGPKIPFVSFGFWAGKANAVICSQMAGADINFWKKNTGQCSDMIAKEQRNFVSQVELVFCVWFGNWFLWQMLKKLSKRVSGE